MKKGLMGRWLWNAQRFGMEPLTLAARLKGCLMPHPVLLVSVLKPGSHIVERALGLWPQCYRPLKPTLRRRNNWGENGLIDELKHMKPGQVLVAHIGWNRELQQAIEIYGIKVVFVCRDPRDVVPSYAHHVLALKSHWQHEQYKDIADLGERVQLALEGNSKTGVPPIGNMFESNSGWLDNGALTTKFNDVIAKRCGGTGER